MTDYKERRYYYRKVGPDAWLKSDHPHKTGIWITQRAYDQQRHIERHRKDAKARYTRRNVRR